MDNIGGLQSRSSNYRTTPLTAEKLYQNDSRRSLPLNSFTQGHVHCLLEHHHYNTSRKPASTASSTTLRRQGSILSSNGHGKDPSINTTTMTLSSGRESAEEEEEEEGVKVPAQPLRRRPGGDLRNNENVHDLETTLHHDSLDSDMTGGSLVIMSNAQVAPKQQGTGPKPISMIKHSFISTSSAVLRSSRCGLLRNSR